MPEGRWIDFILETDDFRGIVFDYDTWLEIIKKHGNDTLRLVNCRALDKKDRAYPYFGEGSDFKEELTLGEWAKQNGMNLNIMKEVDNVVPIRMEKIFHSHQQSSHAG